jgi:hydrogenase maturation protease
LNVQAPKGRDPGFGPDTVLFGIGNCGRSDDGLGWAFLDRILEETGFPGQVEYRYQLQVEDAALARCAGRVLFVDSYHGALPGGFRWERCRPSGDFEFTSHVLPPQAVLFFCQDLYGATPRADLLTIQGTSWDLNNGLSPEAESHLNGAVRFFRNLAPARLISRKRPRGLSSGSATARPRCRLP